MITGYLVINKNLGNTNYLPIVTDYSPMDKLPKDITPNGLINQD